jgi:hypothetical protein
MEFISGNKKRTAIPLIWLLIYLSIVPMQLSNYVLCIGTDGHVGFEIAVNGRCTDAHNLDEGHTEIVITADTVGGNHCGSCLDLAIFISLDIEPYLVSVQDTLIHPPASAATLIACRANGSTLLTHTPLLDIPSVIDPTLVSLRTTTLLI